MGRPENSLSNLTPMRPDLLALTLDDLITLGNRGLLKRAQQELASTNLSGEIAEDKAGNIIIQWSDEILCTLPANKTLGQSQCSCPATSICRHLIRSALFYQSQQTSQPTPDNPTAAEPWNPGDISDETLQTHYKKTVLNKLRSQFDAGQIIKVTTGGKPIAHLHSLALNLRFLVPHDIRYTHCDCDEPAPCSHVPLVIWAFRQLPSEQEQALISTIATEHPVPTQLLDELEQQILELSTVGIAGLNGIMRDRLTRFEKQCRSTELVWIAEILLDILQASEYYQQHDAQFDIAQVVDYLGELLIRSDAIRNYDAAKNPIPRLFIAGSAQDQTVALGFSRLMGLGCGATIRAGGVTLTAYLQDLDSGTVLALPRYFANPAQPQKPRDFWQLAQASIGKNMQLGSIGSGQILIQGGKCTPSYQFIPGRSSMSLNSQSYQWEKLRSPLRVEDFGELLAQLQELPMPALQPRRMTEHLRVLSIAKVEAVEFDPIRQGVRAVVSDATGTRANLFHPYLQRGRFGTEAMLERLAQDRLKFVSARVSLAADGLRLEPIGLVFQSGETRQLLQPRLAPPSNSPPAAVASLPTIPGPALNSEIAAYFQELRAALQELWLLGLEQVDARHLQEWQRLLARGKAIGFDALLQSMHGLVTSLEQRFHSIQWDSRKAQEALTIVTVLSQVSGDGVGNYS
jgi:hypothetical protein